MKHPQQKQVRTKKRKSFAEDAIVAIRKSQVANDKKFEKKERRLRNIMLVVSRNR